MRGLVGLGAEAVDELLGFGDLAVLIDFLLPEIVLTLLELGLVGRIVPGEFLGAAVVESDGAGGEAIHHGAIVRDEDDGALVVVEIGLHEALSVDVEVVGGLVEEEDLGLGKEELGHRDTHLPAAGELAAVAVEVLVFEAQSAEDGLDFGAHAGGIVAIEEEFKLADFVEEIGERSGSGIEFFEFGSVAVDFFPDGLGFGEGGLGFFEKRDALDVDAFLWEVADAVVLWFGDFTTVGGEDSADALHESGLTGPVVSGEGNPLLFPDGKGEVFENNAGTKFHAEVFNGEHAGGLVERRGDENQNSWKRG